MKTNLLNMASITALAFAGCGSPARNSESTREISSTAHGGKASSPNAETATQAAAGSTLALVDRKQASYLTTSLRASSGTRFNEGEARLDIQPKAQGAYITLNVTGIREDAQPWRGSFMLAESELLATSAAQERALASLPRTENQIRGLLHGDRASVAKLALAREAQPGMQPALHGHVLFADGASAEFRSEYDVHCLVPPETLGRSDVQAEPGSPGQLLVEDEEFKSDFCEKFASIR